MTEPYHHGDLRRALLEAAHRALDASGYESLSLRSLANEANVSTGAPYRHFPSRDALLIALSVDGMLRLEQAYRRAIEDHREPVGGLRAVCGAYLNLACQRPQLFRLMFASEVNVHEAPQSDWARAVQKAYDLYERAVAAAMRSGDPLEVRTMAAYCWSAIHGLALLRMHGRLQRFAHRGEEEAALIERVLDRILAPFGKAVPPA
jgi:AcrR family transcriptional regulator